jgi:ATP-dependent DNA helicase RecG
LYGKRGEARAHKILKETLGRGERVFVVCPLVLPSEEEDSTYRDATTVFEKLSAGLPGVSVGLVHGRQPTAERAAMMQRFRQGDCQVLCATTVIEVGVDVPEATLMMVFDADRFGLAQLHQLRGRVGRGKTPSRCLLLAQRERTETAEVRLSAMAESTDGFHIADVDLAVRGPGELLGARQAGLPRLRFGDLAAHTELLLRARAEAEALLENDPDLLSHPDLASALTARLADARAYGAESG